jgi:hypothetical protein
VIPSKFFYSGVAPVFASFCGPGQAAEKLFYCCVDAVLTLLTAAFWKTLGLSRKYFKNIFLPAV